MEDIRIGSRKWYRATICNTNPKTFAPNKNRVAIRLVVNDNGIGAAGLEVLFVRQGSLLQGILSVSLGAPTAILTLERDGSIVYEGFEFQGDAGACTVVETFLDNQLEPPANTARFPGVGIRGPIPTSTP